jgi:hypothetical protein
MITLVSSLANPQPDFALFQYMSMIEILLALSLTLMRHEII